MEPAEDLTEKPDKDIPEVSSDKMSEKTGSLKPDIQYQAYPGRILQRRLEKTYLKFTVTN